MVKSGDVSGQGSPLVGCSMVTSPVSGAWVLHEHDLIFWAAWGATLGVIGVGAGVTFGTAGMAGTAVACGFGVTGVAGVTSVGCTSCAGLAGAGCGTETWCLAGACGVVVVASGTVSAGLTLLSHRCHLVQW